MTFTIKSIKLKSSDKLNKIKIVQLSGESVRARLGQNKVLQSNYNYKVNNAF